MVFFVKMQQGGTKTACKGKYMSIILFLFLSVGIVINPQGDFDAIVKAAGVAQENFTAKKLKNGDYRIEIMPRPNKVKKGKQKSKIISVVIDNLEEKIFDYYFSDEKEHAFKFSLEKYIVMPNLKKLREKLRRGKTIFISAEKTNEGGLKIEFVNKKLIIKLIDSRMGEQDISYEFEFKKWQ